MSLGWENLTGLLGDGIVKTTFGSPELAGIFLLAIVVFFMWRANVSIDGIMIVIGLTLFTFTATGILAFLFWPMVAGMLIIFAIALLRVFRR